MLVGVSVELPKGEKNAPDLVTMCLLKELGYGRKWQCYTMLEKHLKLKQIYASLWAPGNNDTGLIPGIEPIKRAYQRDKSWPSVKQYSLLRAQLEEIKLVLKELEKKGDNKKYKQFLPCNTPVPPNVIPTVSDVQFDIRPQKYFVESTAFKLRQNTSSTCSWAFQKVTRKWSLYSLLIFFSMFAFVMGIHFIFEQKELD